MKMADPSTFTGTNHLVSNMTENNTGTGLQTPRPSINTDPVGLLEQLNTAEVQRLIPTIVYLVLISVSGIIGNSLVCHVYRTRYRLSNSQCFILCLSAIDLFSCCIVIPLEVATILEQYTFSHLWLCKLSRVCNTLGTNSASFLLLFIAIDRFRKVCKPFGWQISSKVAKGLCGFSIVLGLFVSWPAGLIYGRHTFIVPRLNITGTECSTDDQMAKTIWPFLNTAMFGTLFLTGIMSIAILYCLIGREVQKHAQKRPPELGNKSIQMLSSSIDPGDLRVSGDLSMYVDSRKQSSKKQSSNKRSSKRRSKKLSESDISYGDRKSYDLSQSQESKSKNSCNIGTIDGNRGLNGEPNTDIVNIIIKESDKNCNTYNGDVLLVDKEHTVVDGELNRSSENDKNYNNAVKGDPNVKRESNTSNLSTGSDNCFSQSPNGKGSLTNIFEKYGNSSSSRSRNPSISSRFSYAVQRLTSVVSRKSDAGPSAKTQYLKQARARKTAFLMFLISLAFVLSYLPHLLLMLIRQLRRNFFEDMSDSERALYRFFLRSYFLNCAINPVIYGVCDSRFRSAVKQIWSRCCFSSESDD